MLRPIVENRLRANLNTRYFREEDFIFTQADISGGVRIEIKYRYDENIFLAVSAGSLSILGRCQPGELHVAASINVIGFDALEVEIGLWLERAYDEVQQNPAIREAAKRTAEVEALVEQLRASIPTDASAHFTQTEVDSLRARLDTMEATLRAELTAVTEDQAELKRQIQDLHERFQFAKEQVGRVDKPTWVGVFIRRVGGWLVKEENRKALRDGVEVAKLLKNAFHDP